MKYKISFTNFIYIKYDAGQSSKVIRIFPELRFCKIEQSVFSIAVLTAFKYQLNVSRPNIAKYLSNFIN